MHRVEEYSDALEEQHGEQSWEEPNEAVNTDSWTCRRGYPTRTVENRADENSGKIELLQKVQTVRDLWSVGIIGPGLKLKIRHGLGMYDGCGDSGGG